MKLSKQLSFIVLVFSINYFLDRITKIIAIKYLQGKYYTFLGELIVLTYVENEGAFLGAGSNLPTFVKVIVFIILPLLICTGGIIYCLLKENDKYAIAYIVSIAAGGIANIQDRIFNDGKVTDFLNFGIGNLRTGILNVADMSITFGAILLVIHEIRKELKHSKDNK
ncbi:MAG: signal peptidase II [Bacilli bacterium]|nr:signal peptidase II [Bacilli bacterium]